VPDGHVAVDRYLALVRRLLAHDETEHRGLAGTVGPHQADLLAAQNGRAGLDEQDLRAVLLADVVEANHESQGVYYARRCGSSTASH
jgi:hypothetical protein